MDEKILNNISVTIYQLGEKFNNIATKGRARIFYRDKNRNGTYITEEFANKLLSTIPYTPVKGIWDDEAGDFTDHGTSRTQGKIYGVVLENPNITWEDFEDEDGVTRTYACADVIIYTSIYPEANWILGKSLSMEILPSSIKGNWQSIDGQRYFVFTDGSFAGLQALGDTVEPCFEGAQFFELFDQLKDLYNKIQQFNLKDTGGNKMPEINFKLSDREKYDLIWQYLNPEYNEDGGWMVTCGVNDIYDDYALCYNYETHEHFRQYYSKEEDTITFGCKKKAFVLDVTEEEYNALNALRGMCENTFEKVNEIYESLQNKVTELTNSLATKEQEAAEYSASLAEKDAKITELNESIEAFNAQSATDKTHLDEVEASYAAAQEELNSLREFKLAVETNTKQAIIDKYAEKLDAEVLKKYTDSMGDFTCEDLEKELSYEFVKATPSIFSTKKQEEVGYIPKNTPATGIIAILEKHK